MAVHPAVMALDIEIATLRRSTKKRLAVLRGASTMGEFAAALEECVYPRS